MQSYDSNWADCQGVWQWYRRLTVRWTGAAAAGCLLTSKTCPTSVATEPPPETVTIINDGGGPVNLGVRLSSPDKTINHSNNNP